MQPSPSPAEPRNPFYLLLMLSSLLFVVTALGYALLPVLEEKARLAGADVPERSGLHRVLVEDGWFWLLIEVAAMVLFGLLSMGLDRLRRLQKERAEATILSTGSDPVSNPVSAPPSEQGPTTP